MNAAVGSWKVSPADGSRLALSLEFRNEGRDSWSSADGYDFAYQVFDAATDNLIEEGPRAGCPADIAPSQTVRLDLHVDLPNETGRYRVFVSPLKENVAWFYERGSQFLLIEAAVDKGTVESSSGAVSTIARQRLKRFGRTIGRGFTYPFRTMWRHRSLIRSMVRRDIMGRYRGSYGGLFWTVIHPLLMMLTYAFVFGVVLQTRFGPDDRPGNFVLYFMAGMLPWLALSEAVGRAPTVVYEHSNFVKKLLFPVEILPVNLVFAGLFSEVFGVLIFVGGLVYFGRDVTSMALYLPLILIPQFLLTLGLSWFLAALGVFFRDMGQLIGFMLTVWFFTTPICYPENQLPGNYAWLFEKNPLFVLVDSYRSVLLDGVAPAWPPLMALSGVSIVLFLAGHAWFYKWKKSFADLL
ncbi:MAG TPA: ABC transporter permease [Bryobacterales bacterium]|nr:ABC transporter permease [Bryobacterales bacterium]